MPVPRARGLASLGHGHESADAVGWSAVILIPERRRGPARSPAIALFRRCLGRPGRRGRLQFAHHATSIWLANDRGRCLGVDVAKSWSEYARSDYWWSWVYWFSSV